MARVVTETEPTDGAGKSSDDTKKCEIDPITGGTWKAATIWYSGGGGIDFFLQQTFFLLEQKHVIFFQGQSKANTFF